MASKSVIRPPVFLLGRGRHVTRIELEDRPLLIRSTVNRGRVVHHAGNVAFLSRADAVAFVGAPPPDQYSQNIWDSFPRSSATVHPYHRDQD